MDIPAKGVAELRSAGYRVIVQSYRPNCYSVSLNGAGLNFLFGHGPTGWYTHDGAAVAWEAAWTHYMGLT